MKKLLAKIRKILRDRRTRRFLTRFVSGIAALVVFVTTYALVLPAITMEKEANCGIEAHQHDDSCYTEELICDLQESDGHHHDESCYSPSPVLICVTDEHEHSVENGCYDDDGNLVCGINEHQHSDECYEEVRELTCEIPESDGHQHTDTCYEKALTCGKEVHVHSTACYEHDPVSDSAVAASTNSAAAASTSAGSVSSAGMTLSFGDDTGEPADHAELDSDQFDSDKLDSDKLDSDKFDSGKLGSDQFDYNEASEEPDESSGETASSGAARAEDTLEVTYGSENAGAGSTEASNTALTNPDNSSTASTGSSAAADQYIPPLEAIDFNTVLNNHTGIYYHPIADGETVEDSFAIPAEDWNRIPNNTENIDSTDKTAQTERSDEADADKENKTDNVELGKNDLLRVYLSYTIPAGSLNATNPVARYRLPSNLHLTDPQVKAINENINGMAGQYVDMSALEITDPDKYNTYLGLEAVEGTRTPDETAEDYLAEQSLKTGTDPADATEYISAVVRVENVYDTDGIYGEKDAYLGQDLIFTFTPYSIEKNQHEYDSTGKPTKAGKEIEGWLTLDLNMGQVDFEEASTDTIERTIQNMNEDTDETIKSVVRNLNEETGETIDNTDQSVDEKSGETFESTVVVQRVEKIARVVFVEEGCDEQNNKIPEISTDLMVVEETAIERQSVDSDKKHTSSVGKPKDETRQFSTEDVKEGNFKENASVATGDNATADESVTGKKTEIATEYKDGILTAEGDGYKITLDFIADAHIPDDARLYVTEITEASDKEAYKACLEQAKAQMPENENETVDKKATRFFDIEIVVDEVDEFGQEIQRKIEPAVPVSVNIQLEDLPGSSSRAKATADDNQKMSDPTVLHFADEGVKKIESTTQEENEKAQTTIDIQFEAESFSIYGVVYTTINTTVLTASGETYEITVNYGEDAQIPEGAQLIVSEIQPDNVKYADLLNKAEATVKESADNNEEADGYLQKEDIYIHKAMFFDIKIMDADKLIEPKDTVKVVITRKGEKSAPMFETEDGNRIFASEDIIHYADNAAPTLMEDVDSKQTEDGVAVSFETESFSDYGTLSAGYMRILHPNDTVTLFSGNQGDSWVSDSNIVTINVGTDGMTAVVTAKSTNGIATITHTTTAGTTETYKIRVDTDTTEPATIPTVTNAEANIVRMRLIDYDSAQTLDDEDNRGNYAPYNTFNVGINRNHPLKFVGWGAAADNNYNYINQYTAHDSGSYVAADAFKPRFNIVKENLVNGYPELNITNGGTLAYLFNGNNIGTESNYDKWVYDAEGLFKREDGYYVYNSNVNYAHYDEVTGSFSVYGNTYYQQATGRKLIGFFPFNDVGDALYTSQAGWTNSSIDSSNTWITNFNSPQNGVRLPDAYYLNPDAGAGGTKNNGSSAGRWNHHFGVNMAVDFNLSKDGLNDDDKETEFRFSGDDDMWVFVDGKLVLDIGGIHQPISGDINFATGVVRVQTTESGTMTLQDNLYSIFEKDDFVDLDKPHRLEVFYMERGGCDSNCAISFNLSKRKPEYGTVHFSKIAPNQTVVPGAKFQLFYDAACTEPLKCTTEDEATIRARYDQGVYGYTTQEVVAESDENGWVRFPKVLTGTYYMKEIHAPEGYLCDDTVYRVVVERDERAGNATFDNSVADNTTIYIGESNTAEPVDMKVENPRSILKIKKTDTSGAALSGAEFSMTYTPSASSEYYSYGKITRSGLVTDADGFISLDGALVLPQGQTHDDQNDVYGLPDGDYTVTETVPPDGYELPPSGERSVSFTISKGRLTRSDSVVYSSSDGETLFFNRVNKLREGTLGIAKTWIDENGDVEQNHAGTLGLTLKQWVKKETGKNVSIAFQYLGNNNQWVTKETITSLGLGRFTYEFSYAQSTGWNQYWQPQIDIGGLSGNEYNLEIIDTRKYRLTVYNIQQDATINVLVSNSGYDPYDNSFADDLTWETPAQSNVFEETGNSYNIILSSGNWEQVWNVSGTSFDADTKNLPATYNGKDAYYTVEENNIPTNYVLESISTEKAHDQAVLRAVNRKVIDVPVEKTWADFSGEEYTWTATFQLEELEVKEPSNQADAPDAITRWTAVKDGGGNYIEMIVSKGQTGTKFSNLPRYRKHSNGTTYRIQYSVDEIFYEVKRGSEIVARWKKGDPSQTVGSRYTPQFAQDAGESDDPLTEDWYTIKLSNVPYHEIVTDKIHLAIDKSWEAGALDGVDNPSATFDLVQYVHEEYRDYSNIADIEDTVTLTLWMDENHQNSITVPKGMEVSIVASVAAGENANLTFRRNDGNGDEISMSLDNSQSGIKAMVRASFTAGNQDEVIRLTSSCDALVDGPMGATITDTLSPNTDSFNQVYETFTLSNRHWHKDWSDLPQRAEDAIDEATLQQKVYIYSYAFREVSSNPEGYYAHLTNEVTGDSEGDLYNRIYFDGQTISAENKRLPVLKVQKEWLDIIDPKGYPEVSFTLYYIKTTDQNPGDAHIFQPEGPNDTTYINIPLNNDNNWTWTCPERLPLTDSDGNAVRYFVVETMKEANSDFSKSVVLTNPEYTGSYQVSVDGYSYEGNDNVNSANLTGKWVAYNQAQKMGLAEDSGGNITGTINIQNKAPGYISMDISKKFLEIKSGRYQTTTGQSARMMDTVIELQLMRRAVQDTQVQTKVETYTNNDGQQDTRTVIDENSITPITDWENYGSKMLVGYRDQNTRVQDNGNNPWNLVSGNDIWQWTISNANGNQGLEAYGFYYDEDTAQAVPVRYEYLLVETNVYKNLEKEPFEGIDWFTILPYAWDGCGMQVPVYPREIEDDHNRIANVQASNISINKQWNETPLAKEVYVKLYRKAGETGDYEDFTAVIGGDTPGAVNSKGYVTADKLMTIESGEHAGTYLVLRPEDGELVINNVLILPLDGGAAYKYKAEEIGYKDLNDVIRWDTDKFAPAYSHWIDVEWTDSSPNPDANCITIGAKDSNKFRIINTPPTDIDIFKVTQDSLGEITKVPLNSAVFQITQLDANSTAAHVYYLTKMVGEQHVIVRQETSNPTDAEGKTGFSEMPSGYYEIKEIHAPDGYLMMSDVIYVFFDGNVTVLEKPDKNEYPNEKISEWPHITTGSNIRFTPAQAVVEDNPDTPDDETQTATNATLTIGNEPGAELPSCGGSGTKWIYVLGGILTLMGMMLLLGRRDFRRS